MDIFIFFTTVSSTDQVNNIIKPLFAKIREIAGFSFDLEDSDKVLRIEADDLQPALVERTLRAQGFDCREMKYELNN